MTVSIRAATADDEAAVIGLWRNCGLLAVYNDPSADFRLARGKSNSDILVAVDPTPHVNRPLFITLLVFAASFTLACGADPSSQAARSIQSIAIAPATADAQNYPGGQVQLTATGFYNTQPSPVTPQSATWGVCQQNAPTSAVTITSSGVAQCTPGAVGTYTVFAYDFPNPSCLALTACGGGCTVEGTAQLTCP